MQSSNHPWLVPVGPQEILAQKETLLCIYEWKEISSDTKVRDTTVVMCVLWLYFVHRSVGASMQK